MSSDSKTTPLPVPQANTSAERVQLSLRLRFNPIRNLTPELLSGYLDSFRLGFFRQAAQAWDAMERRDDRLQSVAPKRKKSVARHGWEILTVDDSPEAQKQKAVLEKFYNNISCTTALEPDERGGISLLIRQMMDAIGKRYAVHEIVWQPPSGGSAPATLNPQSSTLSAQFIFCPLWWFEGTMGKLRYLASEMALYGVDMEQDGWLVTVGDGLMEACSVAYMFKHLPLIDWLNFSEKFGMPGLLGKSPGQKGSPEWDSMVEAVRDFGQDFAAVVSAGSSIEMVERKGAGDVPAKALVDMMNEAMTILWRGGNLGTMSKADSIGASLQESETDILDIDDAQMISETLTSQVSRFVLSYTFGNAPQLAYIRIKTAEKTNVDSDLKVDTFLLPLGVLDRESTLARYNRPMPGADADILVGAAPAGGAHAPSRASDGAPPEQDAEVANANDPTALETAAAREFVAAFHSDLAPVTDRLNAILQITDPVIMENRLRAFLADMDGIAKDIMHDPAAAQVLQRTIAAAFAKGIAEKQPAK